MAAGVGYLQHKVLRGLFGGENVECDPMALCVKFTGRAFGQGKRRINGLALVFGQPAPFNALLVSSLQVNANLIERFGL